MIYLPKEEFEAKALDLAITSWKLDCARMPGAMNSHDNAIAWKMPEARRMLKSAGFEPKEEE